MAVIPLAEAGPACGTKAAVLGALLRAGLPVPDGFVITDPGVDRRAITAYTSRWRTGAAAVRSSGRVEDTAAASGAGQLATVLGVRGAERILAAVRHCAASAGAARARSYRTHLDLPDEVTVAVIVQEMVAADQAGVLFTRDPRSGADTVVINGSWGLGVGVVDGTVTPDEITVTPPEDTVRVAVGTKHVRLDLGGHGLIRRRVPEPESTRCCLAPDEITALVAAGRACAALLGAPQDVEWAASAGRIWLLQSRPITTGTVPDPPAPLLAPSPALVTGVPASGGVARGPARLVHTADDFGRVRPGDVLVCRTTDPAWTPLFRLAAGIVTETGGLLCHAAIVAREYRLPAVVGAAGALTRITDGLPVVVDGNGGSVAAAVDGA